MNSASWAIRAATGIASPFSVPGQPRVLGDHPVQLAAPGEGELQPDPEPVQRRVARADQPHGGQRAAHAAGDWDQARQAEHAASVTLLRP